MTVTLPTAPAPTLPGTLLYQVLAGSHAYGLAGPGSDADWRGVYQLPTEAYLGINLPGRHGKGETAELPPDQVYYELRHFAALVLAGNPNIMELLWVDRRFVAASSPAAEAVRELRGRYLHRKMLAAYLGWAKSEKLGMTRDGQPAAAMGGKRGSHLARLLYSLRHALRERELVVTLSGEERERVLAIKRGLVSPADALAQIEELEREVHNLAERANWPEADPAPLNAIVLAARRGEL